MADFMTLVAWYTVIFLLTSYVIICGDSEYHRNGIVGNFRSAVILIVSTIFQVCCPRRLQLILGNVTTHLFFKRNHYIQALYMLIFGGVLWGFSVHIHPRVVELELPGSYLVLPYASMAANLALFALCCWSDPGVITPENHGRVADVFEYDGALYQKGARCRTCDFVKPARSKHCAYCDHCVYRFDHHCSWINNCVGGANLRYFLLLLASIATTTAHTAYVTGRTLQAIAAQSGIWRASYLGSDERYHLVSPRIVFQYLFVELPAAVFLATSLALLGLLVAGFLLYHLLLLLSNQTTNERFKRARAAARPSQSGTPRGKTGRQGRGGRGGGGIGSGDLDTMTLSGSSSKLSPWPYNRGLWANIKEVLAISS